VGDALRVIEEIFAQLGVVNFVADVAAEVVAHFVAI
jgi:hypothetical protein